jgi:hypothetical protein
LQFRADNYIFSTGTTERLRITSSGNVGIGTASPNRSLSVVGQLSIDNNVVGSATAGMLFSADASSNKIYSRIANNNSTALPFEIISGVSSSLYISTAGNVGIGTTSPAQKLDISQGSIFLSGSGSKYLYIRRYDGLGTHSFGVGSANAERMRITDAGNIGIGTTSPGAKLEIGGASGELLKLNDSSATGNPFISFFQSNTRRSYIQHNNNGNLILASEYGGIAFFTGTGGTETEKIRITSNGNVGIGTVTPQKLLHINGGSGNVDNLVLESGYVSAGVGVAMQFNRGGGVLSRIRGIEEGNWNGGLLFEVRNGAASNPGYDGATNVAVKIATNGNVGIGTTSPDVRLEVVQASPTDGIIADFVNSTNAGGTTAAIKLSNADSEACDVVLGANRVGANFGSDFFISLSDNVDGSNQERFRITEAGNVGIGTASPVANLHVNSSTTESVLQLTTSTSGALISDGLRIAMIGNVAAFLLRESADMWFATSNTEAYASQAQRRHWDDGAKPKVTNCKW